MNLVGAFSVGTFLMNLEDESRIFTRTAVRTHDQSNFLKMK